MRSLWEQSPRQLPSSCSGWGPLQPPTLRAARHLAPAVRPVLGPRMATRATTRTTLGPEDRAAVTGTRPDRPHSAQTRGAHPGHMADSTTTPMDWEVEAGRHFGILGATATPIRGVDELVRVVSAIIIH